MQLKEGFQNESVESDAFRDGKGDLQIATEIWVEPHCGVVESAGRALQYIDGMKYNEIPEQVCLTLCRYFAERSLAGLLFIIKT